MITRTDILALEFIKKSAYTGSDDKLRFRLEKTSVTEEVVVDGEPQTKEVTKLKCTAYPGPFNFVKTPKEYMISEFFSFDEDGIMDAIDFLNENYDEVAKNYGSLLA